MIIGISLLAPFALCEAILLTWQDWLVSHGDNGDIGDLNFSLLAPLALCEVLPRHGRTGWSHTETTEISGEDAFHLLLLTLCVIRWLLEIRIKDSTDSIANHADIKIYQ